MKSNKKLKLVGKIVLAVFLAIVVGIGVFGTVVGIKEAVKNKRYEDAINKNTPEEIKLSKKEKTFSCEGFSVTLTEDFEISEELAVELDCAAEGIELLVLSEKFDNETVPSDLTAKEYIEYVTENFEGNVKRGEFEGVPFVEYIFMGEESGIMKNYKVFCYKGEDCFWMVHFITESDYSIFYKPYIFEWVKTIEAK